MIYVEPEQRRRGAGSLLFREWERMMHERAAPVLMTSSRADEAEPQSWHRRNGFEPCGALTFGSYHSAFEVFFVKSL